MTANSIINHLQNRLQGLLPLVWGILGGSPRPLVSKLNRLMTWMTWGYPYFRKPPCLSSFLICRPAKNRFRTEQVLMYLRRSRQLRSMWTAGCERTAFWDRQWSRNGTTSREWELHPQANREYKLLLFQRILMPIGPHTIHLSKTWEFAGNSTHSSGIYQQTVTFVTVNVVAHIPMLKCSYSNVTFVSQRPNWEQGTLLSNLHKWGYPLVN